VNTKFKKVSLTLKFLHLAVFFFIILSLSACQTDWTKNGFNLQKWNIDHSNCQTEAAQLYPPQFISYHLPAYSDPLETNCSNIGDFVNCTTSGGESFPITSTRDVNELNRNNAWERCVRARGYYTTDQTPPRTEVSHDNMINTIRISIEEAKNASNDLCHQADLSVFYKKSACNVGDLTLEQLSDKSKANPDEKQAVSKLQSEEKRTASKVVKLLLQHEKVKGITLAGLIKKHIILNDNLYVVLFNGTYTFGEFNQKRQEIDLQFGKEFKKLVSSN
jgi:hypothetical protein